MEPTAHDSAEPDSTAPHPTVPKSTVSDSTGVDEWFAERTYHWQAFAVEALMAAKATTNLTVSLVVPARNEAATVGAVVTRVRERLLETTALLDEIVVIDSDSQDATYAVATDAGATVHRSSEIRPDLGSFRGKGEAMWKSQFVTRGDLVVFMDADLLDWDTHFVPGLLGPLLDGSGVSLVKGFYERPLLHSPNADDSSAFEGGRVTELVARPLIAVHYPQLSGVVQPLAGEWAVTRELLEQLWIPTGYAVELAALIDTLQTRGMAAIGQVDLGRRAHRHQALRDLGAMSTQIVAAVEARLRSGSNDGPTPAEPQVSLRQYGSRTGEIRPTTSSVLVVERPPAVRLRGPSPATVLTSQASTLTPTGRLM